MLPLRASTNKLRLPINPTTRTSIDVELKQKHSFLSFLNKLAYFYDQSWLDELSTADECSSNFDWNHYLFAADVDESSADIERMECLVEGGCLSESCHNKFYDVSEINIADDPCLLDSYVSLVSIYSKIPSSISVDTNNQMYGNLDNEVDTLLLWPIHECENISSIDSIVSCLCDIELPHIMPSTLPDQRKIKYYLGDVEILRQEDLITMHEPVYDICDFFSNAFDTRKVVNVPTLSLSELEEDPYVSNLSFDYDLVKIEILSESFMANEVTNLMISTIANEIANTAKKVGERQEIEGCLDLDYLDLKMLELGHSLSQNVELTSYQPFHIKDIPLWSTAKIHILRDIPCVKRNIFPLIQLDQFYSENTGNKSFLRISSSYTDTITSPDLLTTIENPLHWILDNFWKFRSSICFSRINNDPEEYLSIFDDTNTLNLPSILQDSMQLSEYISNALLPAVVSDDTSNFKYCSSPPPIISAQPVDHQNKLLITPISTVDSSATSRPPSSNYIAAAIPKQTDEIKAYGMESKKFTSITAGIDSVNAVLHKVGSETMISSLSSASRSHRLVHQYSPTDKSESFLEATAVASSSTKENSAPINTLQREEELQSSYPTQEYTLLVSESVIEIHDNLIPILESQHGVHVIDYPFRDAADMVVSEVSCIKLVTISMLKQVERKRDLLLGLCNLTLKYSFIWVFICCNEEDDNKDHLSHEVLLLSQSFMRFPSRVIVRTCSETSLSVMIAGACHHDQALSRQDSRLLSGYYIHRFTRALIKRPEISAACDFLQQFSTINVALATLLVEAFPTFHELVQATPETMKDKLESIVPTSKVDYLTNNLAAFSVLLHTRIG